MMYVHYKLIYINELLLIYILSIILYLNNIIDAEVYMDHNCNFVSVNSTNNNSINFTK